MKKIEVEVLQYPARPVEMTNLAAKLTQHSITSMQDLKDIYNAKPSSKLVRKIQDMGHQSVTRHGVYTIAIVGASRRFLAQIRTHNVGIDFTSGSLQYQDMRAVLDMVVPYEIYEKCEERQDNKALLTYTTMCKQSFENYRELMSLGFDKDTAGYVSCQASRNVLLVTANAEAWLNLINRRSCNRNTKETQYVALLIWKALLETPGGEAMFSFAGPDCLHEDGCNEGKMFCGRPIEYGCGPTAIINEEFPLLGRELE